MSDVCFINSDVATDDVVRSIVLAAIKASEAGPAGPEEIGLYPTGQYVARCHVWRGKNVGLTVWRPPTRPGWFMVTSTTVWRPAWTWRSGPRSAADLLRDAGLRDDQFESLSKAEFDEALRITGQQTRVI